MLQPGDVLFLPPMWFHHVTSITPSVGVNVFSPSTEAHIAAEMQQVPLPFDADWDFDTVVLGLRFFVSTVLQESGTTTCADANGSSHVKVK